MISELSFGGGAASAPLTVRISPRAKVMRLRVDPRTGTVLLTIPKGVSRRKALAWASNHREWVEAALAKIPTPAPIGPGAAIPYEGVPHIVDWSEHRPRTVRAEQGRLLTGGPRELLEARIVRWLKQQARTVLERETREFAVKAGVSVTRVGVGDPVSRWGSCSTSGAIRYSWRLMLAPKWVRRATVAHEVAHRVHMNHGPDFHALVEELLGEDPAPARHWLRREGASLHRIGRGGSS
ncbi:MAG TPA: M48 family metallopeptidase [Allosphingosinicella sp.]|nr:M48 family metallopeptidase [Allosphingosinicella sp.]